MTASETAVAAYLRAWASSTHETTAKGVNFKSARWALSPVDAKTVDARAFGRACEALVEANGLERFCDGPLTLVYATTRREGGKMTVGLATTPPAKTTTRTVFGVAKTTVGDARAIDMVFEDERKRKCEMYAE